MKCPKCESTQITKNGRHHGKQNYVCKQCGRQFVESYNPKGYSDDVKRICLKMYVNGMGFRAIERVMSINHNTIINWVRLAGSASSDAPPAAEIPEIAELDELQTVRLSSRSKPLSGQKQQVLVVDSRQPQSARNTSLGIGDRSAETFKQLWQIGRCWGIASGMSQMVMQFMPCLLITSAILLVKPI